MRNNTQKDTTMNLTVKRFQSSDFRWESNKGMTNASDLGLDVFGTGLFKPLYDDSCDVGFEIRSSVTGKVIRFAFDNDSHEEHCWSFVSECGKYEVVIFND
jgi:hypothetical protein